MERSMSSPDTGQAARVRRYIDQLDGPFAAYQVARALNIPAKKFHWIIHRMQGRGEIQKVCWGWYRYKGVQLNPRPAPIREKLIKAMSILGRFSSREIAVLSDATMYTAQKVVRLFLQCGEIERTGTRRTPRGHAVAVYRVKDRRSFLWKPSS
jgi:hypothetical protein